MFKQAIFFLLTLSLFSFGKEDKSSAKDEGKWEYLYKKETISVYKEKESVYSYMAKGEIYENFFEVLAVASDIKKRPEWVPNQKTSRIVQGDLNSNELVLYEEFHLPWPASNRDVVLNCKITKDYKNKTLLIEYKNISHQKEPIISGIVRVPKTQGRMLFKFIDEKTTHARYEIDLDPGGALPGFITNFFIKKAPLEALEGLMEQIKKTKDQYKNFIKIHKEKAKKLLKKFPFSKLMIKEKYLKLNNSPNC